MLGQRMISVGVICAISLVTLTGCWDKIEIDDRAMVIGSGFYLTKEGQLEVTLQIASPKRIPIAGGAETGQKPYFVITESGVDAIDVITRVQKRLSRKLFLGHRAVLMFDEKFARQGIDQVLSQLVRSTDSRSGYVLTTRGSSVKDILSTPHEFEYIPAIGMKKIQQEGDSLAIRIPEFLDAIATKGKTPITGVIHIDESGTTGKHFRIDQSAVYKQNKLIGFLDEEETKLLLWKRSKLKGNTMTVIVEPKTDLFKGTISIRFLQSKMKIVTRITDNQPQVMLFLHANVTVMSNDTVLDLGNEQILKQVEGRLSEQVNMKMEKIMEKAQKELKADIFDFGEALHIQHPRYWKQVEDRWRDIFPEIPVTAEITFHIERVGRTQRPAHLPK